MDVIGWIIGVAIALAIAVVCYRIADRKGRNAPLWGVLGFLFPVVVLIIILVLGPATPKEGAGAAD